MRIRHSLRFMTQATIIFAMLAAVDLALYEALRHMLR